MCSLQSSTLFAVQALSAQSAHRWLQNQGSEGLVTVNLNFTERITALLRAIFLSFACVFSGYRAPCKEAFTQVFCGNRVEILPFSQFVAQENSPRPRSPRALKEPLLRETNSAAVFACQGVEKAKNAWCFESSVVDDEKPAKKRVKREIKPFPVAVAPIKIYGEHMSIALSKIRDFAASTLPSGGLEGEANVKTLVTQIFEGPNVETRMVSTEISHHFCTLFEIKEGFERASPQLSLSN